MISCSVKLNCPMPLSSHTSHVPVDTSSIHAPSPVSARNFCWRDSSRLPYPAGDVLNVGCSEFLTQFFHRGEHIKIGFSPLELPSGIAFREPPAQCGAHHPRVDDIGNQCRLHDLSMLRSDGYIVAVADAAGRRCLRMNFDNRAGLFQAKFSTQR